MTAIYEDVSMFARKSQTYQQKHHLQKLSYTFPPKLNIPKSLCRKLLKSELFLIFHTLYQHEMFEKVIEVIADKNMLKFERD